MKWIVLLLVLIPFASALEVSPSSLTFIAEQHEEICQLLDVELVVGEEAVSVNDFWGENVSASDFGLVVNYDSFVNESSEFVFCVTGNEIGEFEGELFFSNESVRLDVFVEAPVVKQNSGSGGGGSSGGGGGGGRVVAHVFLKNESSDDSNHAVETLAFSDADEDSSVSEENHSLLGERVARSGERIRIWNFFPLVFIAFVIALKIYAVRRQRRKK